MESFGFPEELASRLELLVPETKPLLHNWPSAHRIEDILCSPETEFMAFYSGVDPLFSRLDAAIVAAILAAKGEGQCAVCTAALQGQCTCLALLEKCNLDLIHYMRGIYIARLRIVKSCSSAYPETWWSIFQKLLFPASQPRGFVPPASYSRQE